MKRIFKVSILTSIGTSAGALLGFLGQCVGGT
jgi:hypothetical protein